MSLKSFDKFCEKLILGDPNQSEHQKEIFDERQKIIRSKLGIEALFICVGATLVNAFISDMLFHWSEHQFIAIMLITSLSLFYWIIRCAACGCLVSVENRQVQKNSTVIMIAIGVLNIIRYLFDVIEKGFFAADGVLSDECLFTLSFAVLIISAVFTLCAICHSEKNESEESK